MSRAYLAFTEKGMALAHRLARYFGLAIEELFLFEEEDVT